MNKKVAVLILLSGALAAGCAATPNVKYVSRTPQQQAKNISIQVQEFQDDRPVAERGKLGGRYSGYGQRLNDVLEPAGMIKGLEQAFIAELQKAGYSIAPESKDLTLSVKILSIGCDLRNEQTAVIRADIKLYDKGTEVIGSVYTGEGSIIMSFDMTGSNVMNRAIEKLVVSFVKDLDEYIKT